jgi:hypothetical protein
MDVKLDLDIIRKDCLMMTKAIQSDLINQPLESLCSPTTLEELPDFASIQGFATRVMLLASVCFGIFAFLLVGRLFHSSRSRGVGIEIGRGVQGLFLLLYGKLR